MELTKGRMIIISSGLAAVIFFSYLILYRPLVKKMKAMGSETKALETQLLTARSAIDSTKIMGKKALMATEHETSLAIDELTKQAKLHKINVVSMTPHELIWEQEFGILPVAMALESGYSELGMFLGALDELDKSIVKVSDFGLIPETDRSPKLKTKLTLHLYISR